ncbi:T9SS type A sorting domain-containing protein [Ginsengibacter hankyongi]|uniref:T9SS type A sorting domain-containing protein n=1 Tax=Ginsengibacter hankyongi TaxID=2607284 RepID=A0A5J5IF60_9BACT|nr:T9SS type A sorting domain-containing protein [Ginsengibacter hankyongi]KAA9038492.1 T9SS type A sorting domain-containing protein [Ginsengibacter hankyongi]
MKLVNTYFFTLLLLLASVYGLSQMPQVINASGGTSKTQGYTLQWSIGELSLINEMDAPDSGYILTNGFIQPPDTLVSAPKQPAPVFTNSIQLNSSSIQLFPNPTQDFVVIQSLRRIEGKVSLLLYNDAGRVIYQREILLHGSALFEKINLKRFPNGIYILYIKTMSPSNDGYDFQSGTFKIIKM